MVMYPSLTARFGCVRVSCRHAMEMWCAANWRLMIEAFAVKFMPARRCFFACGPESARVRQLKVSAVNCNWAGWLRCLSGASRGS
eukprot:9536627-Alexandrium_andersonii.AAC.1